MPPAVLIPILSTPKTPLSTFAGVSSVPINSNFLGFLSQTGLNSQQANADGFPMTSTPKFGGGGLKIDPAMLILPHGMNALSESDLKAFLASQDAEKGLSDDILLALTSGTPLTPELFTSADVHTIKEMPICLFPADDLSINGMPNDDASDVTFLADILAEGGYLPEDMIYDPPRTHAILPDNIDDAMESVTNPLLIATGLTPAQIDEFQRHLQQEATISDDESAMAQTLVLVNFIAVPTSQPHKNSLTLDVAAGDIQPDSPADIGANNRRPLRPFEINLLAKNMADGGIEDKAGYIASFARQVGNDHASANNPANNSVNAATATAAAANLDRISQFFAPSGSVLDGTFGALTAQGLQAALSLNTPSNSPLLNNSNAATPHPATQMLAATLTQAAGRREKEQILSVRLDPPELGRVQVHLSYERGEPLKVRIVAEKQETFSLLQRDAHALKSALDNAGIQADSSSLSFDMAGDDQSFNQMLGQFDDHRNNQKSNRFSLSDANNVGANMESVVMIETHLADIPSFGGNGQGYSFLA